jgi:hypothetical protein
MSKLAKDNNRSSAGNGQVFKQTGKAIEPSGHHEVEANK